MKTFYDYGPVRDQVEDMGLHFDEEGVKRCDDDLFRAGLTQDQVNAVVMMHANEMKLAFTAQRYTWTERLFAVALFLGWAKLPDGK